MGLTPLRIQPFEQLDHPFGVRLLRAVAVEKLALWVCFEQAAVRHLRQPRRD
jgi:hypothetical protein